MAKRLGDFNQAYSKKQKTDLDDLWGDDFDVQDVDDCFQLASQICEQDVTCTQRNISVVPSYNAFKQQTKRVLTSTQSSPELNSSINYPSTSRSGLRPTNGINHNARNNLPSLDNNGFKRVHYFENNRILSVESKLRKVQDQCLVKEGEVSILRSQLKDIKFQHDREFVKKDTEWSEKYNGVTRKLNATKSELEFKVGFEIANLKQQLTDKLKTVNRISSSQSPFFKQPKNVEPFTQSLNDSTNTAAITTCGILKPTTTQEDFKIYSSVEKCFPLQDCIEPSLFCIPSEETYLADFKNIRVHENAIPFSQNQISEEVTDRFIPIQPKKMMLPNGKDLNIDYIQSDIFTLMKCTSQELEMREYYTYINKVICTSEQLCDNLCKFLSELEKDFIIDDPGKVDVLYLKNNFNKINPNKSLFNPEDWLDGELGKSARQSIACVAHILHSSSYLRQYLLQKKHLIFKGSEDYLEYLPVAKSKLKTSYSNNYDYLNIIFAIVNISGNLKNSHQISGFLSAVCILLSEIYSCNVNEDIYPLIDRLTRELVFVCPNIQVLCYLTEFFKNAASHSVFVMNLCKMCFKGVINIDKKEKIEYYKQDVCVLQVFCVFVEYSLVSGSSKKILDLYLTIIHFINNCFKMNLKWMHYQTNEHCDCLCKIVKMSMDVLYQVVEEYKKSYLGIMELIENECHSDQLLRFQELLRNGIELLELLKYRADDIIVKYIGIWSQYKGIIKSLIALKGNLNLTTKHVEKLKDLIDVEETSLITTDESCKTLWN